MRFLLPGTQKTSGASQCACATCPGSGINDATVKECGMNRDYVDGFMSKCAELGVDPEALVKDAGIGTSLLRGARALGQGLKRGWGTVSGSRVRRLSAALAKNRTRALALRNGQNVLANAHRYDGPGLIPGMHSLSESRIFNATNARKLRAMRDAEIVNRDMSRVGIGTGIGIAGVGAALGSTEHE